MQDMGLIVFLCRKRRCDPRVERTEEHLLTDIVFITIPAVICGCETWEDIRSYGHFGKDMDTNGSWGTVIFHPLYIQWVFIRYSVSMKYKESGLLLNNYWTNTVYLMHNYQTKTVESLLDKKPIRKSSQDFLLPTQLQCSFRREMRIRNSKNFMYI